MSQHDTSEDNGEEPVTDDAADAAPIAGVDPQAAEAAATEAPEPPPEAERGETAATEAPEPPPEAEPAQVEPPKTRRSRRPIAVGLALAFVLFIGGAAGYLRWQYLQFYEVLDQRYSATTISLQVVLANVRAVEDRMVELVTANEATRELATDVGERVSTLPGRLLDLEERLNALQGVPEDARRRWLRTEVEYYLTVANVELTLAGRWDNATSALLFADEKLLDLANPAFSGVRERIATELAALRAVRLPDVEGLSYTLGGLTTSGRTLPLLSALPSNFTADREVADETASGLARLWLSLKNAIAGMVSIERRDELVVRSLSTEEQALLRRQLELELLVARLSLVSGQSEVFRQSIVAAQELLARHFDTEQVTVESAIALLGEMALLDIAPERPDISGSLSLLRSLASRDD